MCSVMVGVPRHPLLPSYMEYQGRTSPSSAPTLTTHVVLAARSRLLAPPGLRGASNQAWELHHFAGGRGEFVSLHG